jgi:dephospho-CoA kinase
MKLVVGLIGGMGSGKSLVASLFAKHGAKIVSGDALGHEALRQPGIRQAVVRRWGREILNANGEVDRRRLGAIVFAQPKERRALEERVFPWIERRLKEEIEAVQGDPCVQLVVLDAAIMLEAGWDKVCDRLIFVDAPADVRQRRLAEHRGWGAKEVAAREHAQLSLAEKRNRADYVLNNSGSLETAAQQVERLLQQWGVLTV